MTYVVFNYDIRRPPACSYVDMNIDVPSRTLHFGYLAFPARIFETAGEIEHRVYMQNEPTKTQLNVRCQHWSTCTILVHLVQYLV